MEPDDALGEVFAAAARRIGDFEGDEAGLRSWLFTIAHHRAADHHRRRHRRLDVATAADDLEGLAPVGDDVADGVSRRVDAAGALDLLDHLTPDQRHVVRLRVVAGLSIEETARVLDKPPGAVKSLQHRALARLQRHLDAQAVSEPGDER